MSIQADSFPLHRIGHVDELDVKAKVGLEMAAQGADAEGLGGVVARGQIVDAVLRGLMQDPLGGLAGDVGVETGRDRLVVFRFGGAGDDADRAYQLAVTLKDLGFAVTDDRNPIEENLCLHWFWKDAADPHRLSAVFSEGFQTLETQSGGQLGGIAHLGVTVEWQMVGQQ